jgi:branched-chain amino acid transport system ATP-binding protein
VTAVTAVTTAAPAAALPPVLAVRNIEVIYNRVILVLRGVSLEVPQGRIVALLGGNGAGKSTTLKSISTLLASERGAVTKGSIEFRGTRTDKLAPGDLVGMGMVQVMEGRHCFAHLTVEENLLTGAYTRKIKGAALRDEIERVYAYFPRLKVRRTSLAGYTSGGEQQMTAIGRAMMAKPSCSTSRRWAWRRRSWPRSSRSCAISTATKA